jgi:fatty acid desaturase
MRDERAARLALTARVLHVVDAAVFVALVIAVAVFDAPGWILVFLAPTALLSVAVQLLAFRAEAGEEDLRVWHDNRARWEQEQSKDS